MENDHIYADDQTLNAKFYGDPCYGVVVAPFSCTSSVGQALYKAGSFINNVQEKYPWTVDLAAALTIVAPLVTPGSTSSLGIEAGEGEEPILGQKLQYVFGKAKGSIHSEERSQAMLAQLESVGIKDTPQNRAYVGQNLVDAYRNPSSYLMTQANGRDVRESFLMGPYGGLKLQSIWEANRLITVTIFGGGR